MSHPLLTRTWEIDEVRDELRAAIDLVAELDPPEELHAQTYIFAVQMLTQRAQRNVTGIALPTPPAG